MSERKTEIEYVLPGEIEKRSFEIIGEELLSRGIILPKETEFVTKRVIHASADFEYADTLMFSEHAIETAQRLLLNGADIVTDTNMALSGVHKKTLEKLGGQVHCFMADGEIARIAKESGETRAYVSMRKASEMKKDVIFAIGNAPTALISLYEMIQSGEYKPAFVIGVPVGFVNVEVSKEMIMDAGVEYIVNRGRKGGSTIAAAICNALLYSVGERD